jgi:hypothetical protein
MPRIISKYFRASILVPPFFARPRRGDRSGGGTHQFDGAAEKEPIDGNGGDAGNESGENQHGNVYENPHECCLLELRCVLGNAGDAPFKGR